MEPLFQLLRDLSPPMLPEGAFPHRCYAPACRSQISLVAFVASDGHGELAHPEFRARSWSVRVATAYMAMPEAPVDEAHRGEPRKDEVGAAR